MSPRSIHLGTGLLDHLAPLLDFARNQCGELTATQSHACAARCDAEPSLTATRDTLLLARFADIHPADYDALLSWKRQADARGIAASA